jgi:beta-lactamase superfamily II metal-dependent hydrolase
MDCTKGRRLRIAAGLFIAAFGLWSVAEKAFATPPEYATLRRTQRVDYTPSADDLLRIWIIYVGQGDSILVQLPKSVTQSGDIVDILIDGGPPGQQLPLFLKQLYGDACCDIDFAVLTHHDQDHVAGLTELLNRSEFTIGKIFHNGLVSWRPDLPRFQGVTASTAVISEQDGGEIDRVMARIVDSDHLLAEDLINTLGDLTSANSAGDLHGIYHDWAQSIVSKTHPQSVATYQRTRRGTPLPQFAGHSSNGHSLRLDALWPLDPPRKYEDSFGTWAYTINGNSVTVKLTFGDFEMLFTGDHNDASEGAWLDALHGSTDELRADVLKVPHHGSGHSLQAFFRAVQPVVSVDSMGSKGFGKNWKHPSEDVIAWAGGAHRIYHTYIHERPFKYSELTSQLKQAMTETTHILIETDGNWFRVAELDDPRKIPTVKQVQRSNGTRWIKAIADE